MDHIEFSRRLDDATSALVFGTERVRGWTRIDGTGGSND